jgi:CBS domain containing-hemolysin-like protein
MGMSGQHGAEVHSSEELKILVQQGAESGAIRENDYDIIKNAFDFSERTARQVMIPRTQVLAIDINEFDDKVLERILEEGYSRIPCYDKTLDNIVGVVLLKDMLMALHKKGDFKLQDIIQKVGVFPLNTNISRIMKDFQVKHRQIGIVVNEYGGTEGIVTMEDILEELVGEIQDEFDNEVPFVEYLGDGLYTVLASARIDEINKTLPHSLVKHPKYEKLAGYLMSKFGKIPNIGERLILDDYEVTILKKTRNTIALVQFRDLAE